MNYRIFAFLAATMVSWTLSGTIARAEAVVEKIDMPGIANYSLIEGAPGFAGSPVGLGGVTGADAMPELKKAGFVTVINLRLPSEDEADIDGSRAAAEAAGLKFVNLPLDAEEPGPTVVDDFLSLIGNPANQPVYIHCNSATRAAALWMIGRVLKDGWQVDEASKEVELISTHPSKAIAFATAYLASQDKPAVPAQ